MTTQDLQVQLQKLEDLLRTAGNKDGVIDNGTEVGAALVHALLLAQDHVLTPEEEASLQLAAQVTRMTAEHPDYQLPFQEIQQLLQAHRPTDILAGTADDATSDMDVDYVKPMSKPIEEIGKPEESVTLGEEIEPQVVDIVAAVEEEAVLPEARLSFGAIEMEEMDALVEQEHEVFKDENISAGEVVKSEEDAGTTIAIEMSDGEDIVEAVRPEQSREIQEEDGEESPTTMDIGNTIDLTQDVVGTQMTLEQTWQTGAGVAAPNNVAERLVLRIPKRQRIDDAEYVDDRDREESTEPQVKAKKARTSSSGPRVATWSLEVEPGMDGSNSGDDGGEDDTNDLPAKAKKARRSSSGRRRIVSNATVEPEEMDPTSQAGTGGAAEEEVPPQWTSDGWETYEADVHCDSCERLGIRCFRFRQPEKGRKRWSCFRCHKRKKQCSFNDRRSSAKPSKPSNQGRKSEKPSLSTELGAEEENTEQQGDISVAGKAKEKRKAQDKKKGKDQEKRRRRSSTKPGTKSKQKQKATTTAESEEEKVKKEEDNVEWQTVSGNEAGPSSGRVHRRRSRPSDVAELYGRLQQMEVNVGDHSNRLIDVEQDIDRLQSDSKSGQEFLGQRLAKLGNRVQSTQEELQGTQNRVQTLEDSMMATTETLRGLTETNERIQRGWEGILNRLEDLPRTITNAVDMWSLMNMRGNHGVTGAQLHGPTTSTWFGDIRTGIELSDRQTPPRPAPSQHSKSSDGSPDKLFREFCRQSEDGHDVFHDVVMTQETAPEGISESVEAKEVTMEDDIDTSKVGEELPLTAGQSEQSRPETLEPTTFDVNVGVSPPTPMGAVTITVAANAETEEMRIGEQPAAGPVATIPPISADTSVGSSFNPPPPMPFSPNVIPPTPTSSVHAVQTHQPADDPEPDPGDTLEIPRRSSRWPSPSSSSPPLTRSRSRSRSGTPFLRSTGAVSKK